jgi:hypothetical protein
MVWVIWLVEHGQRPLLDFAGDDAEASPSGPARVPSMVALRASSQV